MCRPLHLPVTALSAWADYGTRGHFNPKEDPAEKEKLRLEMEAREKERRNKAKASIEDYSNNRQK